MPQLRIGWPISRQQARLPRPDIVRRPSLEQRGHRFSSRSDTEAIVHLYEEYGESCVEQLNGQFAFAIWDTRDPAAPKLVMARDRVGNALPSAPVLDHRH